MNFTELKVFMTSDEELDLGNDDPEHYRIYIVKDKSIAQLELRREGENYTFVILDERVTKYGLMECIHKVPANATDRLQSVLRGISHYNYHLNRPLPGSEEMRMNVNIETFKLEHNEDTREVGEPYGQNLVKDGVLEVEDNGMPYGIKITNNWEQDLYMNLFYFDNSDLSITQFDAQNRLLPKEGENVPSSLGDRACKPYLFYVREGRKVDVGFLKVFLSTSPLSEDIQQCSPFDDTFSKPKTIKFDAANNSNVGCILIPVVVRNPSKTRWLLRFEDPLTEEGAIEFEVWVDNTQRG